MIISSLQLATILAAMGIGLIAAAISYRYWFVPLRRFAGRLTLPLCTPRVALVVVGVLGSGLVTTGGLMAVAYDPVPPMELASVLDESPMPEVAVETAVRATTDRGRPITMLKPVVPRDAATLLDMERRQLANRFRNECLLRESQPDDASNCFGWVFTGGRYWVDASEVPHILADNGYRIVRTPWPGDVTVYRNSDGEPLHIAVVRAASRNGPVLVAGKIGWMGVFTHKVEETPYGQAFVYYRSTRRSHTLAGLPITVGSPDMPRGPRPVGPSNPGQGPRAS
ncbi:MAG: hypothetical protein U0746_15035 [Gemmataceae bacterium]